MGARSPVTRKLYNVRMNLFLETIGKDADQFATLPPEEAEAAILSYVSKLNARADRKEIAKATVRAGITPIRAFCVMNTMRGIDWEIIGKTLPQAKSYASDRAPSMQEIKSLLLRCPLRKGRRTHANERGVP
jgi:hypothetical protein